MDTLKNKVFPKWLPFFLIFSTQITSIAAFAVNLSPALFGEGNGSVILSVLYLFTWIATVVFSLHQKNRRTATFGTVYFGITVFCFFVRLLFDIFESLKIKIAIYTVSLFSIFFEVFLYPLFASCISLITAIIFLSLFIVSLYISTKGNVNDNV